MTFLMALSTIASKQTTATEKTLEKCTQLLDYLASNLEAKVRHNASDMLINIHSDTLYLLEANAQSCKWGHFVMGWIPRDGKLIKLNGWLHINSTILQFVVASVAEAELGTLFHNCQTGTIFCSILEDSGHHQPKTPVHCKMQQLSALQTILSHVNNHVRWKYNSFGLVVMSHKICTHLHGIQDRKIWQIISANITWDVTM